MKNIFVRILVIIGLFIFCGNTAADESGDSAIPVTVRAAVDRSTVSIGDKIRYTIEVEAPKDMEVRLPDFVEKLGDFAVRDFGTKENGFWGNRTVVQWYILDTYETGAHKIPAAVIKYRKQGSDEWLETLSEEVTVDVRSLLKEAGESTEIRDIRGPVRPSGLLIIYIAAAVLLAIMVIAAVIMFLKKRKRRKEIIAPPRPAHETALEALAELMKKDLPGKGKVHEYYFELSDIVRQYLENRFKLRAPEMTTEEFLSMLRHTDKLHSEHKSLLTEFLSHCDMVKFARYHPAEKEIESSYESARRLVEQTGDTTGLTEEHVETVRN